jgi:predicted RNase H-like HicB family nuclease
LLANVLQLGLSAISCFTSGQDKSAFKQVLAMELTAVYIAVPEGYIAFVEELPGANTQGTTLKEARDNLQEAVVMVLEANRELAEKSIGDQQVTKEPFVLSSP